MGMHPFQDCEHEMREGTCPCTWHLRLLAPDLTSHDHIWQVGNLGDPLASALRTVLTSPPTKPTPHAGAALLLSEAIGGNCKTLLIGSIMPADTEDSAVTLGLLAQGMAFSTFPLTNDTVTRGLLHRCDAHAPTPTHSFSGACVIMDAPPTQSRWQASLARPGAARAAGRRGHEAATRR